MFGLCDLKMEKVICILVLAFAVVSCSPKKYPEENGFDPSHRYYETELLSTNFRQQNTSREQPKPERKESKESRFGLTSYQGQGGPSGGGGYGTGGNFPVTSMKIDIGGIALGAIIGLGLVLLVPKISSVLSAGGYGGYRSLDTDISSVSDILARIDNSLEQHNIDSSSCVQRTICSYVNDAQKNIQHGEASAVDEFINGVTNNTLFSHMLDGTAVQQAVELGKAGDPEKCSQLYPKCPITKDNILKVLSSLLPA